MIKSVQIAIFLLFSTIFGVLAQPAHRAVVNQPIQWFSATVNIKTGKALTVLAESQYRFAGSFDPMQYQLRTGLEIRLNDHVSIVPAGYVWTGNFLYGEQPATYKNNEHRFWEQIAYKHGMGRFQLDHRLRLEQRFIEVHSRTAEGAVVSEGYTNRQNRLRYRLMLRAPLRKHAIEANTIFISAYDEVFYSWGKPVTFHEPDQNRLFAGLGYQLRKPLTVQAGVLYQMLVKANGAQQENNAGFQLMLNYTLDLTQ